MKIFQKPIRYVVIHHSGRSAMLSAEELEARHRKKGYEAIGFHYLVTTDGRIIPGRSERYQGAHAIGVDNESLGVCLLGSFSASPANQAQLQATVSLVEELGRHFGVPPENIVSHKELALRCEIAEITDCPGLLLEGQINSIRESYQQALRDRSESQGLAIEPIKDGFAKISFHPAARFFQSLNNSDTPLQATLTPPDGYLPTWSGPLKPVGTVFTSNCPIFALAAGGYTLEIRRLVPGIDYNDPTSLLVRSKIELPCNEPIWIPNIAYSCRLDITSAKTVRNFLFEVRGVVFNTGHVAWDQDNPEHPFRVGFLVCSAEQESVPRLELRCDFTAPRIAPGDSAPFHVSINLLELPAGPYYLLCDLLQERRFWFSSFHSRPMLIPFHVENPAIEGERIKDDRYLNSLAPGFRGDSDDTLLYIAPTLPLFDRSAGGARLIKLFELLVERGVRIVFLYEQLGCFGDSERYLSRLTSLGIEPHQNPLLFLSQKSENRYNLCVIGWHDLASRILSGVRKLLPDTRIAIDSVDLHWVRRQRAQELHLSSDTPQDVARAKAHELQTYLSADEVWVVSESEQQKLLAEIPYLKTRVIGIPIERDPAWRTHPAGSHVLFLGGFDHPPNESAALRAAQIIRHTHRHTGLSLTLDIVGSNPPIAVRNLHDDERVFVHGFVPDINPLFEQSCALIAPLLYGAGLKGKIFEAVSRGVPVLSSTIGIEGTGLRPGVDVLVADTIEDAGKALASIVESTDYARNLRDSAYETLAARFGSRNVAAALLPAVKAPMVTLAIVSFDKLALLQRCIKAIIDHTSYPRFRIAVVSNGCSDGSYEWLQELQSSRPDIIKVFRNNENEFFIKPCNFLMDSFPDSDIVLINNDVEVLNPSWLTNLVDAAYSTSHVAASGGRILDPTGTVLEAGCEILSTGHGHQLGHGRPAQDPSVLAFRSVGYVSGALLYMRRDAIDQIAPFDVTLHPMYYEDVDWCYRAYLAGLSIIYTPWSVAIHREGSSAGTDISSGIKRFQEINRAKFLAKFYPCTGTP